MKVLALTQGPGHVCYRYRIEAFAPALAAHGWSVEPLPLAPQSLRRGWQLRQVRRADVVILQRKLFSFCQLCILRRAARKLIFDFDDAIFVRDSYSRKGHHSRLRLLRFWATIYAADCITAGNRFLAAQAARFVGSGRVCLLPTCIDPALYRPAEHRRQGAGARLVWIGQRSTLPSLYCAAPALAAAATALPGLELRVISDEFPCLEGVRVSGRRWSQASEAAEIADADIGISWLPDDPWSLGKCGLKVLQYMAAGLPVVANPVGMNADMVIDGVTGFLASTPGEWRWAIERLANSTELRSQMGAAARRLVERDYSVHAWAPRFVSLIDELAQPAPPDVGWDQLAQRVRRGGAHQPKLRPAGPPASDVGCAESAAADACQPASLTSKLPANVGQGP